MGEEQSAEFTERMEKCSYETYDKAEMKANMWTNVMKC